MKQSAVGWLTLFVSGLVLAGCSTGEATRSPEDANVVRGLSFWQPHLLYLLAAPHPRLYVEVDAVKGCEPSEAALKKFRDFLTACCNKPGGIEIVRSDVIPVAAARGILPKPLARKYLNGPPDDANAPAPAFMYVLYYSGALSDEHAGTETGHTDKEAAPRPRQRDVHCHADLLPYPAIIFMNTSYMRNWYRDEVLRHEAGHLLGLAGRPTHASGYHCLSPTCLMNEYFHVHRLLLGWQKRLCRHCVTQLADSARQPPSPNLRFVGPVLVRAENGYHVLSLPERMKVVVGDLTEQDCRDVAAAVRSETPSPASDNDQFLVTGQVKQEVLDAPATLRDILNRAGNDPYEAVRAIVAMIEKEVEPAAPGGAGI